MKILRFRGREVSDHQDDINRIVQIAHPRGYILSPADAKEAWEAYSNSMAAIWMRLPEDDDCVWSSVEYYLIED